MIVAGFGFNSKATVTSFEQALAATGFEGEVSLLATASDKALAPELLDFAKWHGLTIQAISSRDLEAAKTQSQSVISRLLRRTGSVSEAAALVAAGKGASLLTARKISDDRAATCAIAQGPKS